MDQSHGVSILKPVMPHARDLYELFGFEKVTAKLAASFAGFLQTANPFSPDGATTWDSPKKGNSPATIEAMSGTLQKVGRGDNVILAPGTQRPSDALIALVQAIFREIALGTNLPYGFIYGMAVFGGVTARLETQRADRVFKRFREILINTFLDRVKRKVLLLGIAKKEIRATRNSKIVQFGVKTRTQWWAAELGYDYNDLVEQAVAEIRNLQKVRKRDGVPIELLSASLANPTEMIANPRPGPGYPTNPLPRPASSARSGTRPRRTSLTCSHKSGKT